MTDLYDASVTALRRDLLGYQDRLQRSWSSLKVGASECVEDHRRLARVYAAVLRKFETEVAFENQMKGCANDEPTTRWG